MSYLINTAHILSIITVGVTGLTCFNVLIDQYKNQEDTLTKVVAWTMCSLYIITFVYLLTLKDIL